MKDQFELLKKSEEKFATAFRTSPDAININRMSDGMYIEINDGFTALTGYTPEDVKGKTSLELSIWVNPEDRARLIKGLLNCGSYTNLETSFRAKDGHTLTGLMSAGIIVVNGETCLLSMTRDITARKKAEQALRDSEIRFRTLFLKSPIGVALADSDCRFLEVNDVFRNFLGYTKKELLDLNIGDIIHDQDKKSFRELSDKLVKGLSKGYAVERRLIRKDGSTVWVKNTTSSVYLEDGTFNYSIEMIEDINSRKISEIALKESEMRYKALVEQAGDALFVHDLQGKILEVNQQSTEMLGYSRRELLSMYIRDIEHLFNLKKAQASWKKIEFGIPHTFSGQYLRKDRALVPVEIRLGSFDWRGQKQFHGLVRDISEWIEAEKAIRRKDELIRLTGEMIKAGGWEFDTKTMTGTWTDEVARIHDVEPGTKVDLATELSFYSGESHEKIEQAFDEAVGQARPFDLELVLTTKKGTVKWVRRNGIPEVENGKVVKIRGFFQDITTQKQTEIQRRKSEEQYRSLFENMLNGFAYCRMIWYQRKPYDFVYLDVNKAFATLTGLENVKGRRASEVIPGIRESDPALLEAYGRVARTGKPEIFETYIEALKMWFSISLYCPEKGYFISVFDVIDQRKKAEQALLKNERWFRSLIENVPGAITILGVDGNLKYISPSTEKVMGYRPADVIGLNPTVLTHPEDLQGLLEILADLLNTHGKAITTQYRFLHKNGSWLWIESTITNLFHEPGIEGIVFNFHDITARHMAEEKILRLNEELEQRVTERTLQLEAAIKDLEAFSYSVSHDLRAPLRAIDGFSNAILEDFSTSLPEAAGDYFRRINESAKHMSQLISDLLNLSRVSRSSMHRRRIDFSALVFDVAKDMEQQFPGRKVKLTIKKELHALADPGFLHIAIENLMNNAWKFSSKKDIAQIEFGVIQKNGKQAYFLRDNGAGFDMQYVHQLFVAFQRLHSTKEYPGTGIGLAIVHKIIQQHGGIVWAESIPDKGSTFFFTLQP